MENKKIRSNLFFSGGNLRPNKQKLIKYFTLSTQYKSAVTDTLSLMKETFQFITEIMNLWKTLTHNQ